MASKTADRQPATEITKWEPWREMFDTYPRLAPMLQALRLGNAGEHEPGGDLEETDEAFILELDLPGVAKDDIVVDVSGRRVAVRATRTDKKRDGTLRHSTRVTGSFAYELRLPTAVEDGAVTASLDGGVLTVRMPKAKDAKSTRVPIT
jgi:HSP20 family protein